jgi:hypothetical protein
VKQMMRTLGQIEHASILNLTPASVKLLDTMADDKISQRRVSEIRMRLARNGRRRRQAREELARAREELATVLVAGREAGLDVKAMSELAGVSRETAHTLLRRS